MCMSMNTSTRTQRINVLVSPKEREAIIAAAAAKDLSLSDYVRRSTIDETVEFGGETMSASEVIALSHLLEEIGSTAEKTTKRLKNTLKSLAEKREQLNKIRRENDLPEIG